MNGILTEKDYPIETRWLMKTIFLLSWGWIPLLIFFFFADNGSNIFLFMLELDVLAVLWQICSLSVLRAVAHFRFDEQTMTFRKGLLWKRRERTLTYDAAQNITVKQGFLDKCFHTATLSFTDTTKTSSWQRLTRDFFSNSFYPGLFNPVYVEEDKIGIAGLSLENAQVLKELILERRKSTVPDLA